MLALFTALALAAQAAPIKTPTQAEILAVYPADGRFEQLASDVTLGCGIVAGKLADCTVVKEVPLEKGFGEAALKLADKFEYAADAAGPVEVVVKFDPPQLTAIQKFTVPVTILVFMGGFLALWLRSRHNRKKAMPATQQD